LAIFEYGFPDFCLIKGGMIKNAVVKTKCKPEFAAIVKTEPEHFAVFEAAITENGCICLEQTQITPREFTFNKLYFGQISVQKTALAEPAILIIALFQRILLKIDLVIIFVIDKSFFH
jgi:hypothetical protein